MKWPARTIITATAIAVCGVCAWIFIPTHPGPAPTQAVSTPLPAAPALRAEPTIDLTPAKPIKVYRQAVKAKAKLPAAVVEDAAQHVTTSARLTTEDRPYTLTAVLDTSTGASTIYAKSEPLPWLQAKTRGQAGFLYGPRDDGVMVGRASVTVTLMDIKAARFGGGAMLDTDGKWFAGVGVVVPW